jgi:UPF0755 protein
MVKKGDGYKFSIKDKLWWWLSNLLGVFSLIVLAITFILLLPFKNYESKIMKFAVRIVSICVALALIFGAYTYYSSNQAANFGKQTKYLYVQRGDTVYDIGYKLQQMGAITSEFNFMMFAKILGHSRDMKAGRYAIEPGASFHEIFSLLTSGKSMPFNITILEGLTLDKIAEDLSHNLNFSKEELIAAASDRVVLDSLSIPGDNLEGYLFPDTYNFFYDETPRSVVHKMLIQFYANLPDSFAEKAKKLGMSANEAVTMASMIESEAMLDSERPIISAVYHSRLKIRMRLQCDPTVIYALGGLDRPLYYNDLKIDSPYNTYKYYGLPPGPICSPGKASLEAAVNPAPVDYLYFVAKGDGSHIFSRTNREHINAKNRIKRSRILNRN